MELEKKKAAEEAVKWVKNGMVLGLGTGSTVEFMIQALAKLVAKGLQVVGVPSSERTKELAGNLGIPLTTLDEAGILDLNIDGADEFDSNFRLIKGGGGALLREKIIAFNSKVNLIIADSTKQVEKLGKFKLPIEVIPFAKKGVLMKLEHMNLHPVLRLQSGKPFTTDENNLVIDVDIFAIEDVEALNHTLMEIPGVVETGLFLNLADVILMGKDSKVLVFENNSVQTSFRVHTKNT
ncbi:ribose-5-phosphate isomerase RpiA [Flagellimonas allohymeniacidonis]|uniref:Ribose-5-phosphate isomerase A n=1 Tax=Flagellimonas allohymeniacidonis TaxID=2517819 RepID=A0A4Q8QDI3_9FLAO|nr:ribose-5-phosphate isomerase RpiA [Allomuricauda hymeniacidonis]TAI48532.1 ribose-5-phosphate isomerase RpiA [Allomuricauda hymeniacidonis]